MLRVAVNGDLAEDSPVRGRNGNSPAQPCVSPDLHHHFRHAGESVGEGRDFQVEVDQQILMLTAVIAKTQHDQTVRFVFGRAVGHEAFALEGPQARIEIVTLGGIAAMQVDAMTHAPGFFGELAGKIQPCRRIGAGQDIEVDFGHCGS